ncbi:MAG: L,D-transpeptidase family protein [Victivallales bacterium]
MTNFIYSFKGKGLGEQGNDNDGGTGASFWIILVIVTIVMIALVFIFKSANTASAPAAPEKEMKTEGKAEKAAKPTMPAIAPGKKISMKNPVEYKALSDDCAKAEEMLKSELVVQARDAAMKILKSGVEEDDPVWKRTVAVLNKANMDIFTSNIMCPEKETYSIRKNDNLIKIATDFNTTIEAVMKSNGLNPANPVIQAGRTLKIFKGNWTLKISKKRFKLYLYDGDNVFMVYNIGIGKQGRTPVGTFEIDVKKDKPVWYKDGKQVPYGSKENILGTRWMSLRPVGGTSSNFKGYGIHGTWEPEAIGREASNGCIRMVNEEINDLYMILPLKTTVLIED